MVFAVATIREGCSGAVRKVAETEGSHAPGVKAMDRPPNKQQHPSDLLREGLELAAQSTVVGDWVFGEHGRVFNVKDGTLSPDAFGRSRAFFAMTDSLKRQDDLRAAVNAKPPGLDVPFYVLVIPVRLEQDVLFGYVVIVGSPFHESLFPSLRDSLRSQSCLIGRFAHRDGKIITYVSDVSPGRSVVMAGRRDGSKRRRCHFSIPNEEYTARSLPSAVLGLTCQDEEVAKPPLRAFSNESFGELLPLAFSREARKTLPGVASSLGMAGEPLPDCFGLQTSAVRPNWEADLPWEEDVKSLHPHLLHSFGTRLERAMTAAYGTEPHRQIQSVQETVDFFLGLATTTANIYVRNGSPRQTSYSSQTFSARSVMVKAGMDDMKVFQDFSASTYYAEVLPVTMDEHFLSPWSDDESSDRLV